jgi:UV DNA damage repair endonuclease
MSVPLSLKKTEQEIARELAQSNIKINFKILNYCQENLDVQYRLFSNQMPLQGTEKQARAIVDKHVNAWKATCAHLPVLCT